LAILNTCKVMLASLLPQWLTGQLQRLDATRVPSPDVPESAAVVYHSGATRDLPPAAFAVLAGQDFDELRKGYDFIAYNPDVFRRLLGPQPVIRELHRRNSAFAHEVMPLRTPAAWAGHTFTHLWPVPGHAVHANFMHTCICILGVLNLLHKLSCSFQEARSP